MSGESWERTKILLPLYWRLFPSLPFDIFIREAEWTKANQSQFNRQTTNNLFRNHWTEVFIKTPLLKLMQRKHGLAEEDDLNKQHFNFTSSKYTVKQHWIIREQEAGWSSVFHDKIKINLMQLKIYILLNIFNVT